MQTFWLKKNAFEYVVCKMTAILSLPHFSDYILHFRWKQVKCHKVSLMINKNSLQRCTDCFVSSCPQAASHYVDQFLWNSKAHIYIYGPTEICIQVANWRYRNLALSQFSYAGNLTLFLHPFVYWTPWIWHDCDFCKWALCDLDCTRPHIWNWHAFPDQWPHKL